MTGRSASPAIAAFLAAVFGLPAILLDDRVLATFFHDDAYYYFGIARHVAGGEGFTFDGIHPTNGFHPLWLLILVPIFALWEDPMLPLRAAGLLQAGLIAAAGVILYRTLGPRLGAPGALLAPLLIAALPGSRQILWSGMESGLLLLLMVWVWSRWIDLPSGSDRAWLAPGLGCGLAIAARLEAVLMVPILMLLAWRRRQLSPGALTRLLAPPLIVILSLIAFHRIGFGTWIPVSGMIKAHWAATADVAWWKVVRDVPWSGRDLVCRAFGAQDVQLCPAPGRVVFLAMESFLLILAWIFRRRIARRVGASGTAFLFLTACAITIADVWAVTHPPPWYRGPLLLATAVGVTLLVSHRPAPAVALGILVACVSAGRTAMHLAAPRDPANQYAHYRIEAAHWLARNTPPATRVGSWSAGMLGYFSDRHVVNLDGLVNDVTYYRRVTVGHDLEGYLRDEGIAWIADQACGPDPRPTHYLNRTGSGHLEARCETVAAFFNVRSADLCPGYAIWKIRPEGDQPGGDAPVKDATGKPGGSRVISNNVATSSPSSPAR